MESNTKWMEKAYVSFGIFFLMLLCLYVGAEFEQIMRQRDENLQTISQIAVVNMDTGVERNGKVLNYASGLIQFPDTNFTYTSLEMARNGIIDGSYAAYIIIPEDFSESTVSAEEEPEKINIEYAVNSELREDIYNQVIGDIHEFEVTLNANISYMYVSAILIELHKGQDAAAMIMENDTNELELILGIEAQNLLSELEIMETEYPENELEYLDLSDVTEKNSEYLKNISDYQSEGLAKGQEELKKIQEEGDVWQTTLEEITDTLAQIDITIDEEGEVVYSDGLSKTKDLIEDYQGHLQEKKAMLLEKIGCFEEDQGVTVSGNEVLYDAIEKSVEDKVKGYKQELAEAKELVNSRMGNIAVNVNTGSIEGLEDLQEAVDNLPDFIYDSRVISADTLKDWREDVKEVIEQIEVPDSYEWYSFFEQEVINKILDEAKTENDALKDQSKNAIKEINKYETSMAGYNPFEYIDSGQLSSFLAELNENIYTMESEVNESTMEREEYVADVYSAVLENEHTWKDGMKETYELTSGNIEQMVSGLKQNKTAMNQTNTELLLNFSNLLPYTRLGKVEYTEVYDFVSHPLETQDISPNSAKVLHNRNYENLIWIIIAILIFWLAAGGIYQIYSYVKEEKNQDK